MSVFEYLSCGAKYYLELPILGAVEDRAFPNGNDLPHLVPGWMDLAVVSSHAYPPVIF
jgi:hypothetical protein